VDTSDGTFTPSGSQALIRTGDAVHVFDPETWSEVERLSVPEVKNGESIAMEPDGKSFIIGSEGDNSPLIRVSFEADKPADANPTPTPSPTPETVDASDEESDDGVTVPVYVLVAIAAVGVLALVAVWAARRRGNT
jgi:MYXO-CTERM domain-containing protein